MSRKLLKQVIEFYKKQIMFSYLQIQEESVHELSWGNFIMLTFWRDGLADILISLHVYTWDVA